VPVTRQWWPSRRSSSWMMLAQHWSYIK
jgi:hypothetical protein